MVAKLPLHPNHSQSHRPLTFTIECSTSFSLISCLPFLPITWVQALTTVFLALYFCFFVSLFICLSVYLSICLSVYLSICLSVSSTSLFSFMCLLHEQKVHSQSILTDRQTDKVALHIREMLNMENAIFQCNTR